jgi:YD repeat-containing protein
LQSVAYSGASTVYSATYGRVQNGGNNGQTTSITDSVDSGRSLTYAYDSLNRITSAVTAGSTNYPKWGLSFAYDRYGNRTAQSVTAGTGPANSVTVSTSSNHITTGGYSYDANGNITNDGYNTFTYDGENRIVSVVNGSGSASYAYRASGHRVLKTSGGVTTTYVFDGDRNIADYTGGSLSNEYIYQGQGLLATHSGATLYYHVSDSQSIRAHVDSSGNVVGQRGQYPFGEDWYTSSIGNRHFKSYIRDSESANDYAISRYSVSRLARLSALEPVGRSESPQTLNQYSYGHNDPINRNGEAGLEEGCGGGDPDQGGQPIWCPPIPIDPCDEGCVPVGGGHGSGCGEQACPPPPKPPIKRHFPSLPQCFCQLKFRYIQEPKILRKVHATHSFWYTQDPSGTQWILSAGPSGPNGTGFLNAGHSNDVHTGDDTADNGILWFFHGPSPADCGRAEALIGADLGWPNNTVNYHPILGPNSNSFAHLLANVAGFSISPPPPGSYGWEFF